MSWSDSLQDASFRGVRFDVINTRDAASRDIATYEYPFVDGGDVEDLGRKPRTLRVTVLFWGDDYDTRLQSFLAALDKRGGAEFIHPVFGSMPGMQCTEYQASHDAENVDYCIVEASFMQGGVNVAFFGSDYPMSKSDAIFNQVQTVFDDAQGMIDKALSPLRSAKKMMSRVRALASTAVNMVTVLRSDLTGFVSSTTDFINSPKGYMSDLQSALSLTSSGSKSSVSNNPGSYTSPSSTGTGVAGIVMADWSEGNNKLQSVAAMPEKLATGEMAAPVTMPTGISVDDIEELITVTKLQVALQLAIDASDILSDETLITLLSPQDVEQIANDTRAALQVAIDQHREAFASSTQNVSSASTSVGVAWQPVVNGLKDIALTVQELAVTVITQRPPLITRTVSADSNLHLLAHAWYSDFSRASELLRLNPTLKDPNKINKGDVLNAYAS